MVATYTIGSSAKFMASVLNPIRKSSSSHQDKMFRGVPKMKVNTSYPPQIDATRHRVVSYRCFCQSVHFSRLEGTKSLKPLKFAWACVTPVTKITSSAWNSRDLWGNSKRFATNTNSPYRGDPEEGSGGANNKMGAVTPEHKFMHKVNKSKLEKMKERIRKKSAGLKKEDGKIDPFSYYADRDCKTQDKIIF